MAIVSVHEMWEGRTAEADIQGQRRYTRQFRVRTDAAATEQREILTAIDPTSGLEIPALADPYPEDEGAVVVRVNPQQVAEHPRLWEVSVEYDTETGNDRQDQQEENPLDRPAEIEFGFAQFQKAVQFDLDDVPVQNSAHEPFDPPPEIDDSRPVLIVTKNQETFDVSTAVRFMDTINDDTWIGLDAGQAKCMRIAAQRQFENGIEFWRVQYEFHFRREGWALRVLNRGYYHLGADGKPKINTEKKETAAGDTAGEEAVIKYLNSSGAIIDPATTPFDFRTFRVYAEEDFDELGLTDEITGALL